MSSSMRAAINLGLNYERNLENYKFTNFEHVENLFSVAQVLEAENPLDMLTVKTFDPRSLCWTRSTLAHDQVKSWSKARKKCESTQIMYCVL